MRHSFQFTTKQPGNLKPGDVIKPGGSFGIDYYVVATVSPRGVVYMHKWCDTANTAARLRENRRVYRVGTMQSFTPAGPVSYCLPLSGRIVK